MNSNFIFCVTGHHLGKDNATEEWSGPLLASYCNDGDSEQKNWFWGKEMWPELFSGLQKLYPPCMENFFLSYQHGSLRQKFQ